MADLLGTHDVMRNGAKIGNLTVTQDGLMTRFNCEIEIMINGVLRLAGVSAGEYVRLGVLAPDGGVLVFKKSFTKSALASLRLEPEAGFYAVLQDEEYDGKQQEGSKPPAAENKANEPEQIPKGEKAKMPREILGKEGEEKPRENPKETDGSIEDMVSGEAEKPPHKWEWSPIEDPSVLFDDEDIARACKDAKGALTMEKDGVALLAIPVIPGEPFPMMPVFCFGDSMMIEGREYIIFKSKNGNFTV